MTIAFPSAADTGLLERAVVEALVRGEHADPFAVLGMHLAGERMRVTVFLPGALAVEALDARDARPLAALRRLHHDGLFTALVDAAEPLPYRLRVQYPLAVEEREDPYRFPSLLGDADAWLFNAGAQEQAWRFLGANPRECEGVRGVMFAVWAPAARRVSVVGGFNHWDGRVHVMRRHPASGIWDIFIPGVEPGQCYKYEIADAAGNVLPLKADPYARSMQRRPDTASRVPPPDAHRWGDGDWMARRRQGGRHGEPVSIYEVHLGSWRRRTERGNAFLDYRELAGELIPYARGMGFTHLQLMPVSEHPFDGSWGYQPLGLFAPSSRFGAADDLRHFIDSAHQSGLGVLLDWVPGHFPSDAHGLGRFDGTPLYEHGDPRQGHHPDWHTLIYNYGRAEVRSYLISNALYWLREFHLDGLRFDAVASMLYLDYSRRAGEWIPNAQGGRENLEAISLLRDINRRAYFNFPGIMMVAEESTAWPGVTDFVERGGLGFGFKWNLGWMNDTLSYLAREPVHRRYHHNEMTFGLLYAYSENFILPLSHDEVVHGKRSLLERIPGDDWQKFATLRAYYCFMWTHPGKKLLFMGGEFAQRGEWNHDRSLDWHLLEQAPHRGVQALVRDLNQLYVATPALHELDHAPEGFEWVDAGDHPRSLFLYLRRGRAPGGEILVVINMTPAPHRALRVGVPGPGFYRELINSDAADYGGSAQGNLGGVHAQAIASHGRSWSVPLTVPPLAALILRREEGTAP